MGGAGGAGAGGLDARAQARFAVHAAMSLVIDLGRLMRYERSAQAHATVERVVNLTLLNRYRLRATLPAR